MTSNDFLKAKIVAVIDATDQTGQPIGIVLISTDEWGNRVLPIVIGGAETLSLQKGLNTIDFPRPLTHDLFIDVLENLGANIEKVEIDSLVQGVFTATVYIKDSKGKIYRFDSRPSDAMALAVRANAPIYVAKFLYDYTEDISNYTSNRDQFDEFEE